MLYLAPKQQTAESWNCRVDLSTSFGHPEEMATGSKSSPLTFYHKRNIKTFLTDANTQFYKAGNFFTSRFKF